MDRHWFFTWRTYGTWLPGQTGFVGNYVTERGDRTTSNAIDQDAGPAMPALASWSQEQLTDVPVYFTPDQAKAIASQLHDTACYRGRAVHVLAVMTDHVHLVFGVPGDPDPDELLQDWKRYTSRALNALANQKRSWWARGGSTRAVNATLRRANAIRYVARQESPLLVWVSEAASRLVADALGEDIGGEPGEPRGSPSGCD